MKFFRERVTQPRYNPSRAQHSTLLLIRISDYILVHNHISHVNRYILIQVSRDSYSVINVKCVGQVCRQVTYISDMRIIINDLQSSILNWSYHRQAGLFPRAITTTQPRKNFYYVLLISKLMITKSTIRLGREPTPYCLLFTRAL